jgi:peptide deformylase
MKILPLIIAPDPLLKKISKPVEKVDDALREFMQNMVATMYQENGIGLASVQVGVLKRVLVMDIDYESEDHNHHHNHDNCSSVHVKNSNPQYFINPEIIEFSKNNSSFNEGCLSFPGARAEVIRPESIKLKYLDFNGENQVKIFTLPTFPNDP